MRHETVADVPPHETLQSLSDPSRGLDVGCLRRWESETSAVLALRSGLEPDGVTLDAGSDVA